VVLDSPVGQHHGGVVSGPVFKRIAEQVLAYLGVPHDVPSPNDVETAKNQPLAPFGSEAEDEDGSSEARFEAVVSRNSADATPISSSDPRAVVIPDLFGQTVREVMEQCSRLGLEPTFIGDGLAIEQFPAAGVQALRGSHVAVRFGRTREPVRASAQGIGN
jgi:hypothetical protein